MLARKKVKPRNLDSTEEEGTVITENGITYRVLPERPLTDKELADREKGIAKIYSSLVEIHELNVDIHGLVKGQEAYVNELAKNIDDAHANARKGLGEVVQSSLKQRGKMQMISSVVDFIAGGSADTTAIQAAYGESSKSGTKSKAAPVPTLVNGTTSQGNTVEQLPKPSSGMFGSIWKTKEPRA